MQTKTETVIDRLIEYVKDNAEAINMDDSYAQMLDDIYSFKSVGGPFAHLSPSRVLEECCPTDYRCGLSDYISSNDDWREIGDSYYEERDVEKQRDAFVDDLESQLTDLEDDLSEKEEDGDLQDGTEDSLAILAAARAKIEALQADIKAAKSYTF